MSSILRKNFSKYTSVTDLVEIQSASYYDSVADETFLFPFTYSNGVLDIALIDNFEADMIDSSGNSPGESEPSYKVRLLGGTGVVTSVGTNFQNYIYSWRSRYYNASGFVVDLDVNTSSPIRVFRPATVTRVQMVGVTQTDAYEVSSTPPSGSNYTIGSPANNYRSVWVFESPLTVIYKDSSNVDQYITLHSKFDED